jgi:hypothetical protein
MPWVGFEPTIPAFELARTVHALDRATTVIGAVRCTLRFRCIQCTRQEAKPCMFSLRSHRRNTGLQFSASPIIEGWGFPLLSAPTITTVPRHPTYQRGCEGASGWWINTTRVTHHVIPFLCTFVPLTPFGYVNINVMMIISETQVRYRVPHVCIL